MKAFYWFVTNLSKIYFKCCYKHKVFGTENIIPGRAILAPNHASFLDPPLVGASSKDEVHFLARKSLFASPIFSLIIRNLNAYPVSGTGQDLNSIKLVCRLLEENKKIVIFPEGIRSFDGSLNEIKSGIGMLALRCKSPIVPVYIHGSYEIWDRKHRFPKLHGKTACVFGSPIQWEPFSHLPKKEAQEAIGEQLRTSILSLKSWYDNGAIGQPP